MKSKFTLLLFVFCFFQDVFSQNIGIGTASPQSKLSINGNLAIGSNYISQIAPDDGLIVEGNTGIGTPSPTAQLHTTGSVRFSGLLQTNTYPKMIVMDNSGYLGWRNYNDVAWLLQGNSGTNPNINFLGTVDNQPLILKTNNIQRMQVSNGAVNIGTSSTPIELWVDAQDVCGGMLPFVINTNTSGLNWSPNVGNNTLGRIARFQRDYTNLNPNYFDIGIGQSNFLYFTGRGTPTGIEPNKVLIISSTGSLSTGSVGGDAVGINLGTVPIITANFHTKGTTRFESLPSQNGNGMKLTQIDVSGNLSALNSGTTGQILSQSASGLTWTSPQNWLLTGNAGTNPNVNFLGTLDNNDISFRRNNTEKFRIWQYGADAINARVIGAFDNGIATAAQMDDQSSPFCGGGLIENYAGDTYLRGFWGIVMDKNMAGLGEAPAYNNGVNPAGGCFAVRTRTTSTAFRTDFMIRYNGNTGIGTTDPRTKLHVNNGDVYLDNSANGIILTSPNGNCWRVTVDNTGALISTSITCP